MTNNQNLFFLLLSIFLPIPSKLFFLDLFVLFLVSFLALLYDKVEFESLIFGFST